MLAGFAEFERNVISERTAAALQFQKAHGKAYARALYGFDAVDGDLVANTPYTDKGPIASSVSQHSSQLDRQDGSHCLGVSAPFALEEFTVTGNAWAVAATERIIMHAMVVATAEDGVSGEANQWNEQVEKDLLRSHSARLFKHK